MGSEMCIRDRFFPLGAPPAGAAAPALAKLTANTLHFSGLTSQKFLASPWTFRGGHAVSSKSLMVSPIWPEGVQDTQSKTLHLHHQAHSHLPATTNIPHPATQKTAKSEKMQKIQHPVKSSFHHGGKFKFFPVCSAQLHNASL